MDGKNQPNKDWYSLTGNYSVYGFQIKLSRSLGPFLLSVRPVPFVFVILCWYQSLLLFLLLLTAFLLSGNYLFLLMKICYCHCYCYCYIWNSFGPEYFLLDVFLFVQITCFVLGHKLHQTKFRFICLPLCLSWWAGSASSFPRWVINHFQSLTWTFNPLYKCESGVWFGTVHTCQSFEELQKWIFNWRGMVDNTTIDWAFMVD